MIKRVLGELPVWMQSDQAVLRQEVARSQGHAHPLPRLQRLGRLVVGLSVLILMGYGVASGGFQTRAGETLTQAVWRVLFFPTLFLQIIASAGAFFNATADSERDSMDDALKTTPLGIGLWIRTKWVAGFVRVRGVIIYMLVARLVLVALLLVELTAMRGSYLDLMMQLKVEPQLPQWMTVAIVALGLTGAVLLPLSSLGLEIAMGLWTVHYFKERTSAFIVQASFLLVRLLTMVGFVWLIARVMGNELLISNAGAGVVYGGYTLWGDWGLSLVNITQSGDFWARIPYSVLMSVIVIVVIFVQVALIETMLQLTIRHAEISD